ncbi:MAG: BON domain-containing protein [Gemmatimonadales bacterium]
MARWRVRHHEPESMGAGKIALLAAGVVAGLAAGAYVAHRLGGMSGISARVRKRWPSRGERDAAETGDDRERERERTGDGPYTTHDVADAYAADHAATFDSDYDTDTDTDAEFDEDEDAAEDDDDAEFGAGDDEDDEDLADADTDSDSDADGDGDGEDEFASADPELEDRVLEAFVNDPVLAECPVDIGAIHQGTIELTGAVQTREEYEHATTLARGVPGVETVVNRLDVLEDETVEDDAAAHYSAGDPRYAESAWEGDIVGTGRRRQGTSDDVDRHEDPKVPLENRATSEDAAERDAAGDIDDIAERRRRRGRSGSRSRAAGTEAEPRQEPPAT